MIFDAETEYIRHADLIDTVTNGYQFIFVHDDAIDIEISMEKTAIYNISDDSMTGRFLGLSNISEILGKKFVLVKGYIAPEMNMAHWCFDEKKIGGKYEQDYLKDLLLAYGFVNIRDINNDGVNDTNIEDLDWDGAVALGHKYFCFVSAREVKHVKKIFIEEV